MYRYVDTFLYLRLRLVVEVARFSLDCLQLVLATESADMVLVFSLLHITNTDTTHSRYPLYLYTVPH